MERLNDQDLKRKQWRWASIDELKDLDPLYKTIDPSDTAWLIDNSGNLVPKSEVLKWLNSYERQTPYQEQPEQIRWNYLRTWQPPTLESLKYNPNFDERAADKLIEGTSIQYHDLIPEEKVPSQEIKRILLNDVLGRRKIAYNHEAYMPYKQWYTYRLSELENAINNDEITYREFPQHVLAKSLSPNTIGVTMFSNGAIAKANNVTDLEVLPHEFNHYFQYAGLALSPTQKAILEDAYGEDFRKAVQEEYGDAFSPELEEETTVLDTRNLLFEDYLPNELGKGFEKQAGPLGQADLSFIEEATERSNGYGEAFIKYLRRKYNNNPELLKKRLEKIRRAIIFVENLNNQKNNENNISIG